MWRWDKAARELRFIDDGVGMTEDEVKTNINQVAFSGAKSFMEEYAKNEDQENSGIIATSVWASTPCS